MSGRIVQHQRQADVAAPWRDVLDEVRQLRADLQALRDDLARARRVCVSLSRADRAQLTRLLPAPRRRFALGPPMGAAFAYCVNSTSYGRSP
jgi:hypothetical protein